MTHFRNGYHISHNILVKKERYLMTIIEKNRYDYKKRFAMLLIWLAIFFTFTQLTWTAHAANLEQNKQYNIACTILKEKEDEANALATTMQHYINGITPNSLDSEDVLETTKNVISQTQEFILQTPETGPETSPFLPEQTRLLKTATETVQARTSQLTDLYEKLQNIPNTIRDSQTRKQIQDAADNLQKICDDASKLLEDSKDKVADETPRENLKSVTDKATAFLKEPTENLNDYKTHQKNIQESMTKVSDSVKEQEYILEQQRLEEERRQQEAARQRQIEIQRPGTYENGVWYIDYYNDYYQPAADPNGRLTQWYDNYFIAHDWSLNGQRILSTPSFVVVDGVMYKYIDCQAFSRTCSFPRDIKPFAFRNGGIAFQTCYGPTQILVTHYEPV